MTVYVPRSTWHTGPVVSSSGTPRPAMQPGRAGLVVHYTGMAPSQIERDPIRLMRLLNRSDKPFEYNYVVPNTGVDEVYEFAGTFRAAHCLGHNDSHYGVLIVCGVGEPVTDGAVAAVRWLHDQMLGDGRLAVAAPLVPHRDLRATACPGDMVLARWNDLTAPPPEPPVPDPPAPTPPEENDVEALTIFRPKGYADTFLLPACTPLTAALYKHYVTLGVPVVEETHPTLLKACLTRNGLTDADLTKLS